MNIGMYVPAWPPGSTPNGIVTYASQLVPALRKLGHDVIVFTPTKINGGNDSETIGVAIAFKSPSIKDRVTGRIWPDTALYNLASSAIATSVREVHEAHKLDVFEIEESFGWGAVLRGIVPLVVRLHGPWCLNGHLDNPNESSATRARRERREGTCIQRADFVSAPSEEVLRSVRQYYRLALERSEVIPNPMTAEPKDRKWSLSNCDQNNILYVGRFDSRKGGDVVIRAFATLASEFPELTLTFIGPDRGVAHANVEPLSFEAFVQSHVPEAYRTRIRFLGQQPRKVVDQFRLKSLLTIVASNYEILPYSVLESMAFGCPLVATSVGGIPEMIKNECNGLLVRAGDATALANACRRVLQNMDLAERLGKQAWRDCSEHYDPEVIAHGSVEAYAKAISTFENRLRS